MTPNSFTFARRFRDFHIIPLLFKRHRMRILLLYFFCIMAFAGYGQQKDIPVSISIFNEATAIPFTRLVTTPIHPGIQVGTEWDYHVKAHSRLFQTANLQYYYHRYLCQGVGISSELGLEHRFSGGFSIAGLFGLGYMHTFTTAEEFVFENGTYTQKGDAGTGRLTTSLAIDLSYSLYKMDAQGTRVFLRYQPWLEYPFSPGFIPVMTHINLHAGVKLFLHATTSPNE